WAVGRGEKGGWGHWPAPSHILKTNLDEATAKSHNRLISIGTLRLRIPRTTWTNHYAGTDELL
ncbi:MAG TPA: hypothetical protein VNK89_07450, partial [Thermoflexus sp.]|nr:hypothetical protein [Thermoflexus sp.]